MNIKKYILTLLLILLLFSCGTRKKKEMSGEMREAINKEIARINDNMSETEIDRMMTTAILNYDVNKEVGIMYLEKLVKYRPEAGMYLADYYYTRKEWEKYEEYQKIAAEAGIEKSMYNLAWYYNEVGKLEEAEKWYLKTMEKASDKYPSMHNLAIVYGRLGKYDEAGELFAKIGLTEGDGMYYTGMYYKTKGNYEKAESIYREMIEKGNPDGYFGLGQMYKDELKKNKEAEEFYKKGAEMGEDKSIIELADLYFDIRKYNEAIKYYIMAAQKAEEKGDKEVQKIALFNAGLSYSIQQKYEEAEKWFEKAANLGHEEAKKKLELIKRRKTRLCDVC